jgi:hypothetical protein
VVAQFSHASRRPVLDLANGQTGDDLRVENPRTENRPRAREDCERHVSAIVDRAQVIAVMPVVDFMLDAA